MADSTGTSATSRIRIRVGQVEIEYEGAHAFLSEDLPKLLATVVELKERASASDSSEPDDSETVENKTGDAKFKGTVAAIAAKLAAKKGPDLIIAAAAKLTLVDGQSTFSRDVLLKAMRTAANYYKKSYSANLTNYLKVLLTSNRLTEPSGDNYALTASELDQLKAKLA